MSAKGGPQVDQFITVEFQEGPGEDSLTSRPGVLGVGHDERGALFGEVMHADIGMPTFTHRRYRIDEHLRFDAMRQHGLMLDFGTSGQMVVVPGDQIAVALQRLRMPPTMLQKGDRVTLMRNPEHAAWMNRIEGEYGTHYALPDDFEPVIAEGAEITERDGGKVRAQNGFWYGTDGLQDGSEATLIRSELSLAGTPLPVSQRAAAHAHQDPQTEDADQFGRARALLDDRVVTLDAMMRQWNPHNEKMQPRIREATRLLDLAQRVSEQLTQAVDRLPRLHSDGDGLRLRDTIAQHIGAAADTLERGMDRLGVPVGRHQSSAPHKASLAALSSSLRFEKEQSDVADHEIGR